MSPSITALGPSDAGNEMGLGQWMLSDADGANEFIFNVGPSAGGTPSEEKNWVLQNELGADSPVSISVVMEASTGIPSLQLTGTVLNSTQLGFLEFFATRTVPLLLTDDLERSIQVYATSFEPKRHKSKSHGEMFDYTLSFMVLDDLLDGAFWADYV